jgi:hypothetical protein
MPIRWCSADPGDQEHLIIHRQPKGHAGHSGTLVLIVKNALPSFDPVAAKGGPARRPCRNAPVGDDTDTTSGARDRSAAQLSSSASGTPVTSGITTNTSVWEFTLNSERSSSPS